MTPTPVSPRRLLDHRRRPGSTPGLSGRSLDPVRIVAAFALLLAMTGECVAPRDNAAATSLVMLSGNAGGVVVIVLMGALGQWETLVPWALMGATVVATIALAAIAPETFPGGSGAAKPA